MKIKEMIQALQLQKKDSGKNQLMTVWGEHLNKDKVLEEYPRPQMVRNNYTILNGMWKYAFTLNSKMPEHYDGEIHFLRKRICPESTDNCSLRNFSGMRE